MAMLRNEIVLALSAVESDEMSGLDVWISARLAIGPKKKARPVAQLRDLTQMGTSQVRS